MDGSSGKGHTSPCLHIYPGEGLGSDSPRSQSLRDEESSCVYPQIRAMNGHSIQHPQPGASWLQPTDVKVSPAEGMVPIGDTWAPSTTSNLLQVQLLMSHFAYHQHQKVYHSSAKYHGNPCPELCFWGREGWRHQMFEITASPASGQCTTSSSPQQNCTAREVSQDDGWKQKNETQQKCKVQHFNISRLPRALFGAHEPNQTLPACARSQASWDVSNRQWSKHSLYILPSRNLSAWSQAIKATVAWLWGLPRGYEISPLWTSSSSLLKTEIH